MQHFGRRLVRNSVNEDDVGHTLEATPFLNQSS
jgi:hypothetical protein